MAAQTLFRANSRVGFVELFFDLVFVFAITQVSHHLLYHFDLTGAAQSTLMFLAVWWVWIYTTWVLNRLDPERFAVRMLLFGLLILGLFLSMSIPEAFGDRGLIFAATYVAMQSGRTGFMWVCARDDATLRATYLRILIWFAAAAVFWLAGAFVPPEWRLAVWTLALAIEYAGPAAGFFVPRLGRDVTQNWAVKGAHMAERCGLFVIIALGETLLVSGATFAGVGWTGPGVAAFLGSVVLSIAMWWVYFHVGHHRAAHQIETSEDPGRIARRSFTYAHIPNLCAHPHRRRCGAFGSGIGARHRPSCRSRSSRGPSCASGGQPSVPRGKRLVQATVRALVPAFAPGRARPVHSADRPRVLAAARCHHRLDGADADPRCDLGGPVTARRSLT